MHLHNLLVVMLWTLSVTSVLVSAPAHAHRSGCHRWHSCPSDHGTYECGDTGHCSQCSDNRYCLAGQARVTGGTLPPAGEARPGVASLDAWTCPLDHPIKGN